MEKIVDCAYSFARFVYNTRIFAWNILNWCNRLNKQLLIKMPFIPNFFNLLLQIPLELVLIIVLFILLLLLKKNFSQPDDIPQKSHSWVFSLFFVLFGLAPALYFGWGFYQMKFPNYKYEEVSTQVDFHVYQPTYLPLDIRQASAFVIIDSPIFENLTSVRVAYTKNLEAMERDGQPKVVVLNQSAVPNGLDLFQYLKQTESAKEEPGQIEKISLTTFPGTEAYLVHGSLLTSLWLKTNDGVVIYLSSPTIKTSPEELIAIVESMH